MGQKQMGREKGQGRSSDGMRACIMLESSDHASDH